MSVDLESVFTLSLKLCPNIGNITTKKIINHFGSAEMAWKTSKKGLIELFGVNSSIINHLGNDDIFKIAEKEIELAYKNNIQVIRYTEEKYPKLLAEISDMPVILFAKGSIPNENRKNISIVGTRKITPYGKKFIDDFLEEMKDYPINIISGFAFGVDITAQKKCVELEIPTFGVLAHGLKYLFPKSNIEVGLEILNASGGFLSEYFFESNPVRNNFLERNRIIAGISSTTIIVESAYGGGAMTTANCANGYDREVFALPGKVSDIYSQGCNKLIKNHQAQILTSTKDILDYLDLNPKKKQKSKQIPLFVDLDEKEQKIMNILQEKEKIQIDEMSYLTDLPTFTLMSSLLNLELKGLVNALSGKYFELK